MSFPDTLLIGDTVEYHNIIFADFIAILWLYFFSWLFTLASASWLYLLQNLGVIILM